MIEFLSTYSFLVGSMYLLFAWVIVFFFVPKSNRSEMLATSTLGFIAAPLIEPVFVFDWWDPTFFMTFDIGYGPFGLADFVFGWAAFGIASVAGELFSKERERPPLRSFHLFLRTVYTLAFITTVLFLVPVLIFNVGTVFSAFFAMLLVSAWIVYRRPDLIRQALRAGVTTMIIALPFYYIPLYFRPSWIEEEWLAGKGSDIFITGIPLEELLWFFTAGVLIGIAWEYAKGISYKKGTQSA